MGLVLIWIVSILFRRMRGAKDKWFLTVGVDPGDAFAFRGCDGSRREWQWREGAFGKFGPRDSEGVRSESSIRYRAF